MWGGRATSLVRELLERLEEVPERGRREAILASVRVARGLTPLDGIAGFTALIERAGSGIRQSYIFTNSVEFYR